MNWESPCCVVDLKIDLRRTIQIKDRLRRFGHSVAMENFTPFSALIGGAIIGLAAVTLLLFNGRIAGISGILGGLLNPKTGEAPWRAAFLIGLVLGAFIVSALGYGPKEIRITSSWLLLIAGGVIVGFGTRLGSGCTSGHGVCGLGRLSPRSLAATLIFMAVAMLVVLVTRHLLAGGAV